MAKKKPKPDSPPKAAPRGKKPPKPIRPTKTLLHSFKAKTAKKKLPSKQKHKEIISLPAPEAKIKPDRFIRMVERYLLPYGDPRYSLLFSEDSLPSPPTAREESGLYYLIRDDSDRYKRWMGCLMLGASIETAACRFGLQGATVKLWLRRGCEDMRDGHDTYYARLVFDIRNSIAYAASGAEFEIKRGTPLTYLRRGAAARLFGTDWRESGKAPILPALDPSDENYNPAAVHEAFTRDAVERLEPTPPISLPYSGGDGESLDSSLEGDGEGTFPSSDTFLAALQELETIGLGSFDPSVIEAAKQQVSESDEIPDDPEDSALDPSDTQEDQPPHSANGKPH